MMDVCRGRRLTSGSNNGSSSMNNSTHHGYDSSLANGHQAMTIMNSFNSPATNVPTISFNGHLSSNNNAAPQSATAATAAAAAAYQFHPSTNFYPAHNHLSNSSQNSASTRSNGQQNAIARAAISNQYAAVARAAAVAAAASGNASDPFGSHPSSSLCMPSILCPNPYQNLNSPAGKHPGVSSMVPMAAAVQFQPSASFFSQINQMAAAVANSGQQYVPVSVVEQNGRQMLLTNPAAAAAAAIQSGWPTNNPGRQMFSMPTWQFPATGRIQQPLADATDAWSRSLMFDRAILPEQAAAAAAAILPMEIHHHTDPVASATANLMAATNVFAGAPWSTVVAACGQPTAAHQSSASASTSHHQYSASASNGAANLNNQHHIFSSTHNPNLFSAISGQSSLSKRNNLPPGAVNVLSTKPLKLKEHISPVKKRAKESSPPKWPDLTNNSSRHYMEANFSESNNNQQPSSSSLASPGLAFRNHYEPSSSSKITSSSSVVRNLSLGHQKKATHPQHQTITIEDTPSPAVSVITISDSDDEKQANDGSVLSCSRFLYAH